MREKFLEGFLLMKMQWNFTKITTFHFLESTLTFSTRNRKSAKTLRPPSREGAKSAKFHEIPHILAKSALLAPRGHSGTVKTTVFITTFGGVGYFPDFWAKMLKVDFWRPGPPQPLTRGKGGPGVYPPPSLLSDSPLFLGR